MRQVDNKPDGSKWLWAISGPRWALEAFYIENVRYFKTVPSGPLDGDKYIDVQSGLTYRGYELNAYTEDMTLLFLCGLGYTFIALILMKIRHRDKKK